MAPARTVTLEIVANDESSVVRLTTGADCSAEAPFDVALSKTSRTAEVVRLIESGGCNVEDLKDVGSQLWAAVFNGKVRQLFDEVRKETDDETSIILRLKIPPTLRQLPWEALHDETTITGFLACSKRYAIVRDTSSAVMPQDRLPLVRSADKPLTVLVVIPEGSGLGGVEREWRNFETEVVADDRRIRLERLQGRVTVDVLRQKLRQGTWDVIHYIGHGLAENGSFFIRLNEDDSATGEQWVDAERFSILFEAGQAPSLVVLNCCLGATASTSHSLSGVGAYLMRVRVPAVVAMQYEIPDDVAIKFAGAFYNELLRGPSPGRVDLATGWARQTLFINRRDSTVRAFVTPILYLAPGTEALFEFLPMPEKPSKRPPTPAIVTIDGRLTRIINGVKAGRAVPVLGPGVLRAGALRAGPPAPNVVDLVKQIGTSCNYPRQELELVETAGEWLGEVLLPRVCQQYAEVNERYALIELVQSIYRDVRPTETLRALGDWPGSNVITTYFDGVVDEALTKRRLRSVNAADRKVDIEPHENVLLRLRGTCREEQSLVLTQEDHDDLYESLGRVDTSLTVLIRGRIGRFPLFLGVSPRDRLARRLMRELTSAVDKNQATGYFITTGYSQADKADWECCKLEWVDMDLGELLDVVNAAIAV